MNRYIALASMDEYAQPVAEMVYEKDDRPEKTGLLDQHGTPLFRVRDRIPFGFQGRKK